jgi:hypothetical protein
MAPKLPFATIVALLNSCIGLLRRYQQIAAAI